MRRRRATIAALPGLWALAVSRGAHGQTLPVRRRVGIIGGSNATTAKLYLDPFRDELAQHGWVEGRNVTITVHYMEGDPSRLVSLAAEMVTLGPDVIVAINAAAALATQRATKTIPIVTSSNDPVALGLVKSFAHPGGNITGVSVSVGYDIMGKRLEMLKEWLPRLKRVAVIHNPTEFGDAEALDEVQRFAASLGVQLTPLPVRAAAEIEPALSGLSRHPPDAVYLFGNGVNAMTRATICPRLLAMGLPSTGGLNEFVDEGCLLGYSLRLDSWARELSRYVDQILRGAKPADLPVRQPTTFELVINARTAKALGLSIPPLLRLRADRVIE